MVNKIVTPIQPRPVVGQPRPATRPEPGAPSFKAVLDTEIAKGTGDVRFSAHAQKRLATRKIHLSDAEQALVRQAVDSAALKGARESLLVMDKVALVVSVPKRTVITAMVQEEMHDSVFTNIDSAVIVRANGAVAGQGS